MQPAALRDPAYPRQLAFPLVLVPALVAVLVVGQLQYGLLTDDDDAFATVVIVCAFVVPFVPIAIALQSAWIRVAGSVFAFAVGVVALVAVPWAVDRAIADDPSSTAPVIHVYDPVLDTLAVLLAVGVAVLARRLARP